MQIRKANGDDLPELMRIYAYAREFMRRTGNPNQWGDSRPSETDVAREIAEGNIYAVAEDGNIHGVFFFSTENDSTYDYIEGEWLNGESYGVIHKIANDGQIHGMLNFVVDFCCEYTQNIRIDTHEDNKVMQHQLGKAGFRRCGIIYLADGQQRIAYQKIYGGSV